MILIDNSRIKPITKVVFVGEPVSFVCDSQGNSKWFFVNTFTDMLSDTGKIIMFPKRFISGNVSGILVSQFLLVS